MVKRTLNISQLLGKRHSAFLFGPRGVGKTRLCSEFLAENDANTLCFDFLSIGTYRKYSVDPTLFRKEIELKLKKDQPLIVFIDEVQKLPILLDEVHSLIESYKNKIRFLMTGSSARKLKREGANLLAGRALTLHLHPFTSQEIDLDLNRAMQLGTLPAIYLEEENPVGLLNAYVDTYLKEEIMQEAKLRKVENFIRFLDVAGQSNGKPINYASVARDAGVSDKIAREYFSILVDTLIAFPIYGWSYSTRKQLRQSPKYYFFDCGILNAINGDIRAELKPSSYRYGRLFENFVICEIIRNCDYLEKDFKFFYWQNQQDLEVDLILSRGPSDTPKAIEIKSQANPDLKDLKGILAFKKDYPQASLYCLCQATNEYEIEGIKVLPWRQGIIDILNDQI